MRLPLRMLGLAVSLASFAFVPERACAIENAPTTLRVLRHLVFTIGTDLQSKTETKVSGIDGPASGTASNQATTIGKGTIAVDVVAVTADGGLVVDVTEDTDARKAATARVAILGSAISYDPARDVTDEELQLLRCLSRTFVKPGELTSGTTWSDQDKSARGSDQTTYTVSGVDPDKNTVDLNVDEVTTQAGASGFEGTTRGTVTYDTSVLVPLSLSLWTRRYYHPVGQLVTVDMKMTSTLTIDSFRKAAH